MNSEKLNNKLDNSDEISIKDLIIKMKNWVDYLRSKGRLIIILTVIGVVLGVIYASSRKALYIAKTTFVLEEGGSGGSTLGNLGGLASIAGINLGRGGGGIFQGNNILELYKSRKMIEKTLLTKIAIGTEKQLLVTRFIEVNGLKAKWQTESKMNDLEFQKLFENNSVGINTRLRDSLLNLIVNDIKFNYLKVYKPDEKLSIIEAEVKSRDEMFAKLFNEEIVKNVNDFYLKTQTKRSLETVAILQQKTDSVRAIMNSSIFAAAAVSDATPNLNLTRQSQRVAPAQKSQFNAEINRAMLTELVKNLEMAKITLRKEAPLLQVVDEPMYPLNKEKLGKLKGAIIGGAILFVMVVFVLSIIRFVKLAID